MPYILQTERPKFDKVLDGFYGLIQKKGELEYCVYRLMNLYMADKKRCYADLHDTVYAVHHAAHEWERNNLDVREDEAKALNGEIE